MANKWEQLPGDLLRNVENRLIWYADKVRLRCVCKSWRSELTMILSRIQPPLSLLPSKLERVSREFFDIIDNTTYDLALHEYALDFVGSFKGWVVATFCEGGKAHVFMFNPLTGSKKPLPSALITGKLEVEDFPEYIYKCVVSSDRDDYKAAALTHCGRLIWTKFGEDTWHAIPAATSIFIVDIIFHEGRLHVLRSDGLLLLVEIGSANPRVIPISSLKCRDYNIFRRLHLVETCMGLLLIESIQSEYDYRFTNQYYVYKYNCEARKWSSELTDIGDEMLFVGGNVLASRDSPNLVGFKANTICFFNHKPYESRDVIYMKVWDLKTGKMKLWSDFNSCGPHTPFWFSPVTMS